MDDKIKALITITVVTIIIIAAFWPRLVRVCKEEDPEFNVWKLIRLFGLVELSCIIISAWFLFY